MGARTDADIAAWQKRCGIAPATGEMADRLEEISKAAYELIRLIELECSGIRDGNGHWYGSDPLASTVLQLHDRWQAFDHLQRESTETQLDELLSTAGNTAAAEKPDTFLDDFLS